MLIRPATAKTAEHEALSRALSRPADVARLEQLDTVLSAPREERLQSQSELAEALFDWKARNSARTTLSCAGFFGPMVASAVTGVALELTGHGSTMLALASPLGLLLGATVGFTTLYTFDRHIAPRIQDHRVRSHLNQERKVLAARVDQAAPGKPVPQADWPAELRAHAGLAALDEQGWTFGEFERKDSPTFDETFLLTQGAANRTTMHWPPFTPLRLSAAAERIGTGALMTPVSPDGLRLHFSDGEALAAATVLYGGLPAAGLVEDEKTLEAVRLVTDAGLKLWPARSEDLRQLLTDWFPWASEQAVNTYASFMPEEGRRAVATVGAYRLLAEGRPLTVSAEGPLGEAQTLDELSTLAASHLGSAEPELENVVVAGWLGLGELGTARTLLNRPLGDRDRQWRGTFLRRLLAGTHSFESRKLTSEQQAQRAFEAYSKVLENPPDDLDQVAATLPGLLARDTRSPVERLAESRGEPLELDPRALRELLEGPQPVGGSLEQHLDHVEVQDVLLPIENA